MSPTLHSQQPLDTVGVAGSDVTSVRDAGGSVPTYVCGPGTHICCVCSGGQGKLQHPDVVQ